MNNLLDPANSYIDESESRSYGDVPPPATPARRGSVDVRAISPLPEKKLELTVETKHVHSKSFIAQTPPPPPPPPPAPSQTLRGSADLRPVSPLPDKKSASDVQVPLFVRGCLLFSLINIPRSIFIDSNFFLRRYHLMDHLRIHCFPGKCHNNDPNVLFSPNLLGCVGVSSLPALVNVP